MGWGVSLVGLTRADSLRLRRRRPRRCLRSRPTEAEPALDDLLLLVAAVAASSLGVQHAPRSGIPLGECQGVIERLLLIYLQCGSLVSRLRWLPEASGILKLVPLCLVVGPSERSFGLLRLGWSPLFLFAGVRFLQVLSVVSVDGGALLVHVLLTKRRQCRRSWRQVTLMGLVFGWRLAALAAAVLSTTPTGSFPGLRSSLPRAGGSSVIARTLRRLLRAPPGALPSLIQGLILTLWTMMLDNLWEFRGS